MGEEKFLKHYGVKGMKWGVINEDKGSGKKSGSKEEQLKKDFSDVPKVNVSTRDQAKNLAANKEAFANKFGASPKANPTDGEKRKFNLSGEDMAAIAIGAVVAGAVIYKVHQSLKANGNPFHVPSPGDPISVEKALSLTRMSESKMWGGKGYLTKAALDREEFTIPVGNVFHRVSTTAENGFSGHSVGTYVTHNVNDFNRYASVFRHELFPPQPIHHITFTGKKDIKVPSTRTVLETMQEVLRERGDDASPESAMRMYNAISGKSWSDDTSKSLVGKLAKKGYGAIVDEMDAGVIGETPLVLFERGAVSKFKSVLMSAREIKEAESSLVEMANRKP